jgi:hypothetical protein
MESTDDVEVTDAPARQQEEPASQQISRKEGDRFILRIPVRRTYEQAALEAALEEAIAVDTNEGSWKRRMDDPQGENPQKCRRQ